MENYFKNQIEKWAFFLRFSSAFKSIEIAEKVFGDDFKEIIDAARVDNLPKKDQRRYFKLFSKKQKKQKDQTTNDLSDELARELILMGLTLDEVSLATGIPIEELVLK